jgi:hypothetical protein
MFFCQVFLGIFVHFTEKIWDKKRPTLKGCTLKDSFKLNRYSTYQQEKDEELVKFLVLFLTSTASVDTADIFSYEL